MENNFVKKLVERIFQMPFDDEYLEKTILDSVINYLEDVGNKVDENSELYNDIHEAVDLIVEHRDRMMKIIKFYEKMNKLYQKVKKFIKFETVQSDSDDEFGDEIGDDTDVSDEEIKNFLTNSQKLMNLYEELDKYYKNKKEFFNN